MLLELTEEAGLLCLERGKARDRVEQLRVRRAHDHVLEDVPGLVRVFGSFRDPEGVGVHRHGHLAVVGRQCRDLPVGAGIGDAAQVPEEIRVHRNLAVGHQLESVPRMDRTHARRSRIRSALAFIQETAS